MPLGGTSSERNLANSGVSPVWDRILLIWPTLMLKMVMVVAPWSEDTPLKLCLVGAAANMAVGGGGGGGMRASGGGGGGA